MYRLFVISLILALFVICIAYAEKVVLIVDDPQGTRDVLIVERLEAMGHTVESHSDNEAHPVDLDGADLLFITATVTSTNLGGAYADSTIPVINCEGFTYDDMGFIPADPNIIGSDTIAIVNADHPITQGFPEEVTVYNSSYKIMSGRLEGDVDILAVRTDNPEEVTIGVYEEGAKTLTGETKARHITLFVHDQWPKVNDDGWELVERSVVYALEKDAAVEPANKLAVTWASVKKR